MLPPNYSRDSKRVRERVEKEGNKIVRAVGTNKPAGKEERLGFLRA